MSCNVPVASTNVLIYIRHAFNFVYFKSPVLFLLGKPERLFETTHPDWALSPHLGDMKKRYEKSVKEKFWQILILHHKNVPLNVPLKKKIIDVDTDDNTIGKFLKRSL